MFFPVPNSKYARPIETGLLRRKLRSKSENGFTLVELMITIAIIGILAAIAIPNFIKYREKSRISHAQSELKSIEMAITDLILDTNLWPTQNIAGDPSAGSESWDLSLLAAGLVSTDGNFPDWAGPYLDSIPIDPWGNNYFFDEDYTINGADHTVIGSFGPNGVGPNLYDADDVIIILNQ